MMKYLIDGYNLMFRSLHAGKNLQEQREELIAHINSMVKLCEMEVTMVFDSKQPEITRSHFDSLEIIYTDENQSADDYLIWIVKHAAYPIRNTVVTSDNRLAWSIRRHGAKSESIEQFMAMLYRRSRNVKRRVAEPPKLLPEITPKPKKGREITVKSGNDDYLIEFEKRFQQLAEHEGAKAPKAPEIGPTGKYLSDEDRWLELFERKLDEESE
jgi:predicted RNA-binding protein with PIN domain